MTKIAFVGTGFVADYYMKTLENYPDLQLICCFDRNAERLEQFTKFHGVTAASGLDDVLSRDDIDIVVNLANPQSHLEINRAALEAGKHVYCEKPLAMSADDARALAELAADKSRTLHSAPANALCPAFVKSAEILKSGAIGQPRMIYAEMEDGPVFREKWQTWKSISGAAWPGIHEFEIGCTLEHAGYALSWLLALFGPVRHLAASTQLVFPDKGPGTNHLKMAPDLTVGLLKFDGDVQARLSCGLATERNRSLTVIGESGTLTIADLWDWNSPIRLQLANQKRSYQQRAASWFEWKTGRALPFRMAVGQSVDYGKTLTKHSLPNYPSRIDFAAGIDAQARAIETGKEGFFGGDVSVHMTEVTLALHAGNADFEPQTVFSPDRLALQDWPEPALSVSKRGS
ncbi:MAG: Gfo/Idh/MocA family oxidoreductase [Hyphomicrobiales bacterium]|nr:Gfo/Idh/MocA family oxidoreductase [Hyphomicrobiales bacterium]MCP5001935.1 Gfo/Idh/MocA family oxidoreductase [Hyphomicrobiales bacterium]